MRPVRVLVVDDEPGIRGSLSGVLGDEGCEVECASEGESCIARLIERSFDVVLLDVWLPGIDGLETLERIQRLPASERPAVVMISGHGNIETAVKATKLGAFDFLEKPLTIDKVTLIVKNAASQRRLERQVEQLRDRGTSPRIIGESIPMKALRQQLALMASTNGRVLIFGESGTGKELVAHAIHE
ncbi:MAG: sigma-54-dependent Fis family transcriptional regulator, partial [Bryobacteraceae bacterium]|nr:sigma-54-dependent Fis family transcriptional regulator [Bryobacteraceae bacterium]